MGSGGWIESRSLRWSLGVASVLLWAVLLSLAPAAEPLPLRKVLRKERAAAIGARDHADQLMAKLEPALSATRMPPENRPADARTLTPEQIDAEATEVVRAYQEVLDGYPHTEIAAYCILRLAGFCLFMGDLKTAARLQEEAAEEYAGTPEESQICLEVGTFHLQGKHDPAEALKWFSRVGYPGKKPPGALLDYDESDKHYLAAQESMIRCELALHQDAQAKECCERLEKTYPQYEAEIRREYETAVQIQQQTEESDEQLRRLEQEDPLKYVRVRKFLDEAEARLGRNVDFAATYPHYTAQIASVFAATAAARARLAAMPVPVKNLALEKLLDQMEHAKPGTETEEAVAALTPCGDEAVAEIERRLVEGEVDFGWRHKAVRVLKAINTEKARAILFRMAMGELGGGNPNQEAWAARALIACEPRQAWPLLASSSHEVQDAVLAALMGQPIEKEYVQLLKPYLESKDVFLHWKAVAVLAREPSGDYADHALDAIGHALAGVADLPNGSDRFQWDTYLTVAEWSYERYLSCLVELRVTPEALHKLAQQLQGRARDVVFLALAQRGDTLVHPEMIRLAQDAEADMFRLWATRALEKIGTAADLPLLEKLATTDPCLREMPGRGGGVERRYVVRDAAKVALRAFETRQREKATKSP